MKISPSKENSAVSQRALGDHRLAQEIERVWLAFWLLKLQLLEMLALWSRGGDAEQRCGAETL